MHIPAGPPPGGVVARCGEPQSPPPPPPPRLVEDSATFSNELERDNRRDTAPTYADYIEERNRRLRQFRADLARDLPLFGAPQPIEPRACAHTAARPTYSGATLGDVLAKIGPAPAPPKVAIITDLSVMGSLIDQLI